MPMIEILPGDVRYPVLLGAIPSPPRLYVRGSLEDEDALAIAIVGSRHATPYGVGVAEQLAAELAARGVTIVSGLARGIDTAAHRGALAASGRTLAVLGCGVDVVYPPENVDLARSIEAHGALLSQFAPGLPALAGHFPARNRTIAGLVLGVVVVEAAERGGGARGPRAGRLGPAADGTAVGLGHDACGESVGGEAIAGGGGVADEGEDDPEISGLEIHRQGVDGARARSAEIPARRRSQEGIQAKVRRFPGQEKDPGRAEEGRRTRRHSLHRHRPRP